MRRQRVCVVPGCPELSDAQRCDTHEREFQAARNRSLRRGAYRDPGYRRRPRPAGICHLCGQPGADTWDHVVPLAEGGTNDTGNLRPAHGECNSRKGGRYPAERTMVDPEAYGRETR